MANKVPVIIGSLLIAGVALVGTIMVAPREPTTTIPFTGSDASLKALSIEAKRCGISRAKVEQMGKFLALAVETSGPDDKAFLCLIKWVDDHPESKIGFLGNGAIPGQIKP